MTPATLTPAPRRIGRSAPPPAPPLPITVRQRDGSEETVERPATWHRASHLGLLHAATNGYVEIAAGRRGADGDLHIYTRHFPRHFLPGGATGGPMWREPLLHLAEQHHRRGEEVFLGAAPRATRRGVKEAVHFTRCLWMDVDHAGYGPRIDAFLEQYPAHVELATAGGDGEDRDDGHRHFVWMLSKAQVARTVIDKDSGELYLNAMEVLQGTGGRGRPRIVGYRDLRTKRLITNAEVTDWIERWNYRMIHQLGHLDGDLRKYIADKQCRERARVLRLAGTVNKKTGRYARIARVDRSLPPYDIGRLVEELRDPPRSRPVLARDLRGHAYDAYRLIPTAVYFPILAGVEAPGSGNIHCPSPTHPDVKESCSVDEYVFHCFGCGAQGSIYDLWALMTGRVTGDELAANRPLFHTIASEVRERCRHLV
jgi:hypothetical protein